MQSSFRWALLGLVIDRPSYGYELWRRFERAYSDAIRVSRVGQIYEGLTGLEHKGLIESFLPQPTALRQPRPHYRATDAGLEAYGERLANFAAGEHVQMRLFVRELAVFAHRRPDAALACLNKCEQTWLDESAAASSESGPTEPVDAIAELAARLENQAAQLSLEAKLSWVEFARAACAELGRGPGSRREPA
jgi:DNA-binding PadR family transcriptional regulator